jgi:NAD(P)-dependent dehydrogenase (short-subunit alcohol dehydrogenase family)
MIEQLIDLIKKYQIPVTGNFQKTEIPLSNDLCKMLPSLRMAISVDHICTLQLYSSPKTKNIIKSSQSFLQCITSQPDEIFNFLKSNTLFIKEDLKLPEIKMQLKGLIYENNQNSFILVIENTGIIAVSDNALTNQFLINLFQFIVQEKISGAADFSNPNQSGVLKQKKVDQKIVIVTGGAQGFGEGVVKDFFENGANIVIADINEQIGLDLANKLNSYGVLNRAFFVKTDITQPESVQNMVKETVQHFGGIDCLISNAGILIAGGLDELSSDAFDKVTKVNYYGYFNVVKYVSEILKIQSIEKPGYFTDIIQISSKSGLKGSSRNFAYSGSKFGGIGLTQSFALELVNFNIKVNSVCPGNFFEGSLWSDPEKGLFMQYLQTGKVPGAKTIDDVKNYYESKVPMKRGCTINDVLKAIYYLMEQNYETGQAIAVTGGQIMLD